MAYKFEESPRFKFEEELDISPVSGMSTFQRSLAGIGKSFADLGLGARQALQAPAPIAAGIGSTPFVGPIYQGLRTLTAPRKATLSDLVTGKLPADDLRREIEESRRLSGPLMETTAGKAGNIGGSVAAMLPAAFMPGANTVLGGSLLGAGLGFLQPSLSASETATSTALGGAGGGLGVLAGRAIPTVAKALIDPFRKKGQEAIVARTLGRFAGDQMDEVMRSASRQAATPGVRPTLAEATQNPGMAVLQRGAESVDPTIAQAFAQRGAENNAAMMGAIRSIAGSAEDLAKAERVRSTLTKPLYEAAKKASVESDDTLRELLAKPSIKSAWARAQALAAENGESLVQGRDIPAHVVESKLLSPSGQPFTKEIPEQVAKYSGKGLHYLKMALDDMIDSGPQSGIGKNEARALNDTRIGLQKWLEKKVPEYDAARRVYAALSQQPNEMVAASELAKKLQPALMDFSPGAPTRLRAQQYAQSLRDLEEQLPKLTGFPGATIKSTFFPGSVGRLQGVAKDLAARANVTDLARGPGSNTAQNLASQNLVRQIFGPMGLPQSWSESMLAQTLARPYGWATKLTEPKIQGLLADALLDPAIAEKLMRQYMQTQPGLLSTAYSRALPVFGATAGLLPAQQ